MNWEQLKAILWLRWRLSVNQSRKAGAANFVLMVIIVASLLVFAAISFFLAIGLGIALLPTASPLSVLIAWDVMVGVLLFSWTIALLIEVQRMEMLSLEKLLHLPMSLQQAFAINYLASWISLSIVCFFPAALGLVVAMAVTHGLRMLLLVPVLLSFLWMLTAVTYQFRGWLGSLLTNKRRQRTIITLFTLSFVALAQAPNIVIQLTMRGSNAATQQRAQDENQGVQELTESVNRQEISQAEYEQRIIELRASFVRQKQVLEQARTERAWQYLTIGHRLLPVGWLPYASVSLLAGSVWQASLCWLGLTLIGAISLWRAYASTIRHYTGNVNRRLPRAQAIEKPRGPHARPARVLLVERRLPGMSEHSSAIAVCSLQNLLRAPEAKMLLIGPLVLGLVFMLMVISNGAPKIPAGLEPLVWLAGVAVLTFMCMMLMMNIFGMDRHGFRCFVLMPVRRSVILFGKNISLLPAVFSIAVLFSGGLFYLAPVGISVLVAASGQMLTAFMMASLIGNWVSICFPIAMSPGSGKPVQMSLMTILIQMVLTMLGPLVAVPGLVSFGIELVLKRYFEMPIAPVFLLFSLVELVGAFKLYHYALERQGNLLQARETRILEGLTLHAE